MKITLILLGSKMNKLIFTFVLIFVIQGVNAQTDSLILNNDNIIVGELKDMDRGVLTIETDYSDSDFKIEWEKIKRIRTETNYLITLSDGRRFNGNIATLDSTLISIYSEAGTETVNRDDIVFLKSVDSGFWDQLNASIDLGYSHTKANNLNQFSIRSGIGYLAERWSADANYNNIISTQDDVEKIKRLDADLTFRYYLPKDWYILGQLTWLSNTEQAIKLRTVTNLGLGKYLIHTNQTYWGVQAGGSFNNETYSTEAADRQSAEAFFGTELNMYDIGDFSLLTNLVAYPSLTESGRWRVDYSLDTKYDLPLDFYIKIGFTLNFDNQPVEGASDTDYVLQTSFGWEL